MARSCRASNPAGQSGGPMRDCQARQARPVDVERAPRAAPSASIAACNGAAKQATQDATGGRCRTHGGRQMPALSSRLTCHARFLKWSLGALVGLSIGTLGRQTHAQSVAVSYSGVLETGQIDTLGLFGPVRGKIGNQPFSMSLTLIPGDFGVNSNCFGPETSTLYGAATTSITINGKTFSSTSTPWPEPGECTAQLDFGNDATNLWSYGPILTVLYYDTNVPNNGVPTLTNPGVPATNSPVQFSIFEVSVTGEPNEILLGTANGLTLVSPFLLGAKDLGNLDLPQLLPKLTTPDSATALAADGTSAAIVLFQVPTIDPVTFTTNNGTTLIDYKDNHDFLAKPPAQGKTTLEVTPISIGSLIYAVALLQAPPAGVAPTYSVPIVITAQQAGGQMQQAYLPLVPPPVVLVHGIWGDHKSLKYYFGQLTAAGSIYGNQAVPYVLPIDYTNDVAFNDPGLRSGPSTLSRYTDGFLKSANLAGIVAGRVDVVAHSMGGLVARAYSGMSQYTDFHDREQGAIHQIITLDTPEQGSALASFLLQPSILNSTYQNQDLGEEPWVWIGACGIYDVSVETCFAGMKPTPLNITEGAVASLVPGNQDLNEVPGPAIPNAIWNAISATVPQTDGKGENALEIELQDLIAGTYIHTSQAPTIADILADNGQDDAVVPASSQTNGGPAQSVTVPGLAHISAPSVSALRAIHLYFHKILADDGNVENSAQVYSVLQCWLLTAGSSSCNSLASANEAAVRSDNAHLMQVADREDDVGGAKLGVYFPSELRLATPFKLPISTIEGALATSIIVYQTDELRHNAEPQELPVQHDWHGRSYVTVTPTLLGSVTFTVEAAFLGGQWLRKDVVTHVGMPVNPPVSFKGDRNFRQIVLRENGYGGDVDPVAFYSIPGQDKPVEIDLRGRVECRQGSDDADVIQLHSDCTFYPVHAGKTTVEVAFGSLVDTVEVFVMGKNEW